MSTVFPKRKLLPPPNKRLMITLNKPQVYIIESLRLEDEARLKEGEIISRALRMSGKEPRYEYVRTRQEFEHFVDDFRTSKYRYLHLSCHGNEDEIAFTFGNIGIEELAAILRPALKFRRLFLSACETTTKRFAEHILSEKSCYSVAGPEGEINFDDSAIIWSAFYHVRFKKNSLAMNNKDVADTLRRAAVLVGQPMRLFTRGAAGVKEQTLS